MKYVHRRCKQGERYLWSSECPCVYVYVCASVVLGIPLTVTWVDCRGRECSAMQRKMDHFEVLSFF